MFSLDRPRLWPGVPLALGSAILFGASTPFSKLLLGTMDPWLLSGLLYFGAGLGLLAVQFARRALGIDASEAPLQSSDYPWLVGCHCLRRHHRATSSSVRPQCDDCFIRCAAFESRRPCDDGHCVAGLPRERRQSIADWSLCDSPGAAILCDSEGNSPVGAAASSGLVIMQGMKHISDRPCTRFTEFAVSVGSLGIPKDTDAYSAM